MLNLPFTFLHRSANPMVRHPWLLVLMHGVGSNEHDLFSLAPQIPEQFHVVSLRAPFRPREPAPLYSHPQPLLALGSGR